MVAVERGDLGQGGEQRTAARAVPGVLQGLGEEFRREPAVEGEQVGLEAGGSHLHPVEEGADRRHVTGILAEIERRVLLEVVTVDRRRTTGPGDEVVGVGGGTEDDRRVVVLLLHRLQHARGVVLRHLVQEDDLHAGVLHGDHVGREVGLEFRVGGVVDDLEADLVEHVLLTRPCGRRRRTGGHNGSGGVQVVRELVLEVLDRTFLPPVVQRHRAEHVRKLVGGVVEHLGIFKRPSIKLFHQSAKNHHDARRKVSRWPRLDTLSGKWKNQSRMRSYYITALHEKAHQSQCYIEL